MEPERQDGTLRPRIRWGRPILASVLILGLLLAVRPDAHEHAGPAQEPAADVKQLFELQCGSCHGSDGRGAERGPDIVATRRAAGRSAAEIERVIRQGIPAGGMPPSTLPDTEISALARYVRSMADG